MSTQQTTETAAAITAKVAPPATVSIATLMGYQVSELVLWATFIYTVLMIVHKLWQMFKEFKND